MMVSNTVPILTTMLGLAMLFSGPASAQQPLPENIMETVTFLFPTDQTTVGMGTGFFVMVDDQAARGIYVVTAKHVLMSKSKDFFPRLCMRVNTAKGGTELIPVDLSSGGVPVWVNTDPDVDIAVIAADDIATPSGRTSKDYSFRAIPVSGFATKEHFEKRTIAVGDEAFLTGWFSTFYGATQNLPIARFGRLAMVPDDKIPLRDESGRQTMVNLYLIEALVTKGNSGSPVFFRPTLQRDPTKLIIGKQPLFLAGVLSGYLGAIGTQNAGIAAVVPAFHLHEILFSKEAIRHRGAGRKRVSPKPEITEACLQAEKHVRKYLGQP